MAASRAGARESRYRLRPRDVQAFQLTQTNRDTPHLWPWWLLRAWQRPCEQPGAFFELSGSLLLTNGERVAEPVRADHWIVRRAAERGIELTVLDPAAFAEIYEPVE